jgi:amino acid transporter
VFGFFFLCSLLFSIQDFDSTLDSEVGQPVLQIFVDVFGKSGATAAFSLIIVCVTLCGTFSVTSNSRMFYAFSRDRALPGFFDVVDKRTAVPLRTSTSFFFPFLFRLSLLTFPPSSPPPLYPSLHQSGSPSFSPSSSLFRRSAPQLPSPP